jgi:glycosyltransferase involved in cell wall biosynthesis
MKIAIVHYWWIKNRGGEYVVKNLLDIYPSSDLFLHVCDDILLKNTIPHNFSGKIYKTFISKLPLANRFYQKYLPLMPLALEALDLSEYDLIISSESGPAKFVITRPDAIHICYCHSPMRYIWDLSYQYIKKSSFFIRLMFPLFAHYLRQVDLLSAFRVDLFIANSNFIKSRIKKIYRRDSVVIHPPVNTNFFSPDKARKNYFLYFGELTSYKRVDLAVEAFNILGFELIIVGDGEERVKLEKLANSNITFLGRLSNDESRYYLETCRALIFPGLEDFGIVPVEAMAAGAPVIAFGKGGILDTVEDGVTGILFDNQSSDSLISAISRFEASISTFSPRKIHQHSKCFDVEVFKQSIQQFVLNAFK